MSSDELKALATIMRHRDTVRLNIQRLTQELDRRALGHDLSKLALDELEGFVRINETARTHPYGSVEYETSLASEKRPGGCIALHFRRNSHHPEFHALDHEMGFLDIIEMVLDWKAAADTYGTNTLRESLPVNRERFRFTAPQWWLIEQVVNWIEPESGGTPPESGGTPSEREDEHER